MKPNFFDKSDYIVYKGIKYIYEGTVDSYEFGWINKEGNRIYTDIDKNVIE